MTYHRCPVKNCPVTVSSQLLMCKAHWYQVPRDLRSEVSDAYLHQGVGSPRLLAAQRAAIEAVNGREGE